MREEKVVDEVRVVAVKVFDEERRVVRPVVFVDKMNASNDALST